MAKAKMRRPREEGVPVISGAAGLLFWMSEGGVLEPGGP